MTFLVQPRDGHGAAHRVEGESFEDAAIAFAERWSDAQSGELSLLVRDLDTGAQHCLRIDLGDGDIRPC